MKRKFSELTSSEQVHFNNLVEFMRDAWNEDINNKFKVVEKFRLDPNDPVVFDFLTDFYVPTPNPDLLYGDPSAATLGDMKQALVLAQPSQVSEKYQAEKTKKREMTYANSEDLIVIQNRLLHAISNLTLNERRLILFLSPIARKEVSLNNKNKRFIIRAVDFSLEYNIKKEKSYQVLEQTADSILKKAFWFWNFKDNNPFGKKTHKTGLAWVTRCDYIKTQGELIVDLHEDVIEMLTIFDKATGNFWTQYQKDWIINLGTYGIIMLEMVLSSLENKGYYTIEHLREKFDCVGNYDKFSNFKIWVIDKAIKEIHQYTPIRISYEQHKKSRSVVGLTFSYTDTSIKSVKNKEKNDDKPKENNPFVNFKMSEKQLGMFASKIKKATGQDIDEIISELCNVHLQGKHTAFLKVLDFVPSDWYTQEEVKSHPTAEQIAQAKKKVKQETERQEELEQAQLKQDYETLLANAEEFVLANQKRIGVGIEKMYFQQGDYQSVVRIWERYLLDKRDRKGFALLNEILSR